LNPKKTLPEQDIKNNERVILKKKFFVTDQNVDRNDPVQLNLLYNQNKESIIKGKYPCTSDEASQFAAIQFQIQYGNHDPSKHKPGFIK
jgi:talin